MAPRACGCVVASYSAGSGVCGCHVLVAGSMLANGVAQRAAQSRGAAELTGKLSQQVLLVSEIAARAGDLVPQDLREREVLQQRDDVGEGFVKGPDVGIGGLEKVPVHAVEQRMRRLVRDDVVRRGT